MAGKLAVTLFHTFDHATKAVRRLEEIGIPSHDISFFCDSNECRAWSGDSSKLRSDSVAGWLSKEGVPQGDAHAYAEGVRRGNAVVAVRCTEGNAPAVMRILEQDGVMDLDEHTAAWRAEGWSGYEGATATGVTGGGAGLTGRETGFTGSDAGLTGRESARTEGGEQVIPIAEEKLTVGKRETGGGRVRIHSYTVSTPVQEQVTLREEHVSIDRRSVDRPLSATDADLFRERTVEMEEHREEAVVSKEARVREELVVRKDVNERTETVQDEVRRTEVEVDDARRTDTSRTTGTGRDRL